MILHRFCSQEEFESYKRGELLINEKDHSKTRGTATTSVGFCWFTEKAGESKTQTFGNSRLRCLHYRRNRRGQRNGIKRPLRGKRSKRCISDRILLYIIRQQKVQIGGSYR